MYTVIGSTKSRTLRVLWMLEELGLPYEHVSATPRSPDVVAVNPTGKVPVLLLDDVFSELDESGRAMVVELAGGEGQVMMTATEVPEGLEDVWEKLMVVEGGRVSDV